LILSHSTPITRFACQQAAHATQDQPGLTCRVKQGVDCGHDLAPMQNGSLYHVVINQIMCTGRLHPWRTLAPFQQQIRWASIARFCGTRCNLAVEHLKSNLDSLQAKSVRNTAALAAAFERWRAARMQVGAQRGYSRCRRVLICLWAAWIVCQNSRGSPVAAASQLQAGFKAQLQRILVDVEAEEGARRALERRLSDAQARSVRRPRPPRRRDRCLCWGRTCALSASRGGAGRRLPNPRRPW
jgi:hypothetical protein